ncbi:HAMP domain-containing sensor histidine kinase [Bdellovibrionota bacterium FG-1]
MRAVNNLSLKERLGLVFTGLLVLTLLFCVALFWQGHRTTLLGVELAIQTQEQMVAVTRLRDVLIATHHGALAEEKSADNLARIRALSERSLLGQSQESSRLVISRYETYAGVLLGPETGRRDALLQSSYRDFLGSVDTLMDRIQATTYYKAEKLRHEQGRQIYFFLGFFSVFVSLFVIASFKAVSAIVRPLSSLVGFLDTLWIEEDFPEFVPGFDDSEVPEVRSVAKSFSRLLSRLRCYRALNVRRLLIEKRRADIITASITDGVFLMRGEDVLYVNPVAEGILGFPVGQGISLAQYVERPGSKAVLTAISRTMPVEFTLEDEFRKVHYLIQAYPIASEVIEQAESSMRSVDEWVDRFQADMIVVATDVTLVREAQDAKQHFLGTLSHEVKTPVTSLIMATRLLKRTLHTIENSQQRALISTCIDDVERLRGLLDDLLSVSKFETITQHLELQRTDLAKLLRHTVQSFQPEARKRSVELVDKITKNQIHSLYVEVDPSKISWALSNLVTNALRHTPSKGRVEAELEVCEDQIEIRVKDTGPGIERKRQGRIFDKFNPHYDLRIARTGSAGVGLAIAREIIVAHGGRIWVVSEPGRGAEFCFSLPFKKQVQIA